MARPMTKARLAAILAVVLGALTLGAAAYSAIANFPRGLIVAVAADRRGGGAAGTG